MKFCQNCGNELMEQAVICPNCGCSVGQSNNFSNQSNGQSTAETVQTEEKDTLARFALAFAFLIPIVGIILGIIGIAKYETETYKKRCIIAIPIAVASMVLWFIINSL